MDNASSAVLGSDLGGGFVKDSSWSLFEEGAPQFSGI